MKTTTEYGDNNSINLKMVIALSRTQTSFARILQQYLSDYNLTIAQFGVMEALYHLGDLKICELIEKTLSTSGNMTVVIRNLEKEALIERRVNNDDRRAFLIALTEKGRMLIKPVFEGHLTILDAFFDRLTADEREQLLALLKKLNGLSN